MIPQELKTAVRLGPAEILRSAETSDGSRIYIHKGPGADQKSGWKRGALNGRKWNESLGLDKRSQADVRMGARSGGDTKGHLASGHSPIVLTLPNACE